MIEKIREQPYRAPADDLVRYHGLNNRLRRVPRQARYFLVEIKDKMNFHPMLKYGMWANSDDSLVYKLSEAVENTGRTFQPAIDFGPSVCIILYADRKLNYENGTQKKYREFRGIAQVRVQFYTIRIFHSEFDIKISCYISGIEKVCDLTSLLVT